jgi:dipeptidyl aminopeptidase/acylaminoacyl peptidase
MSLRARVVLTIVVAAALVVGTVTYAGSRRQSAEVPIDTAVSLTTRGLLVRDGGTGHLAVVDTNGHRAQAAPTCLRTHAAAGRAACLRKNPGVPGTFELAVLDSELGEIWTTPAVGIPTRTRLSADGRMVAWTVFIAGHSYADDSFSTVTSIADLRTQKVAANLESFALDDGKPPVDANFWGVTFASDDTTFYVTMASKGRFHLVRGDLRRMSLTVVADGIECPSLSPDGTRLAYKKRLPDLTWRLWVFDLEDQRRHPLAETENIDDQAVWLDERTIGYGRADLNGRLSVWSVPADGTGTPTLLVDGAESPAPLG